MIATVIRVTFLGGPLDGTWCDFEGQEVMPVALWATVTPLAQGQAHVDLDPMPVPGIEHYRLEVMPGGFLYRWGK